MISVFVGLVTPVISRVRDSCRSAGTRVLCLGACYVAILYLAMFLLLMDSRGSPCDPKTLKVEYGAVYRFADWRRTSSGFTIYFRMTSWANTFFWPLDRLVYNLLPDHNLEHRMERERESSRQPVAEGSRLGGSP
jgi:hypothetical protein